MASSPGRRALRAWLVAAPLMVTASAVPTGGLFRERGYVDVDLYGRYATGLADGRIPYRDVFVEYPPGAFAVLLPPALAGEDGYRTAFKLLMMGVALAGLWCLARTLAALGAGPGRLLAGTGFVALAPLLLGSVWLNSYDVWPGALTVAAALALVSGYGAIGLACLGLAAAAKVYALVLVPPALLYVHARSGRRSAARAGAAFAAAAAILVAPFLVVSPGGVWDSLRAQLERGLHVESTGSAALLVADRLGLYEARVLLASAGARSRDLPGDAADIAAVLSSLALALAVAAVWLAFARRPGDAQRLATAFAASVAGVLAFSKVLSPQYAEWLLFLVPLAAGAAGIAAAALAGAAFLLARLWFHHYDRLYAVGDSVWLVTARNAALVACFGVLLAALVRVSRSSSVSPP